MKKTLALVIMLICVSCYISADDEITSVTISKGVEGYNTEQKFAYDYTTGNSIIVWSSSGTKSYSSRIYSVLVKTKKNGKLKFSKPKLLSNPKNYCFSPSIAFNHSTKTYMVAWSSQLPNTITQVAGRKLNGKGKPLGGIIKIVAYADSRHESPRICEAVEWEISSPSAVTPKFMLIWNSSWYSWVNEKHGVYGSRIDTNGKLLDKPVLIHEATSDPNTDEPASMYLGDLSVTFGGFYFFTLNKYYRAYQSPAAVNPNDTFIIEFGGLTNVEKPLKAFSNLGTTGRIAFAGENLHVLTWADYDGKGTAYNQLFKYGPKKYKGAYQPMKDSGAWAVGFAYCWDRLYQLIDSKNGLTILHIDKKGKIKENMGTTKMPVYLDDKMVAWLVDGRKKLMIVNTVQKGGKNLETELIGYIFNAPGWEDMEGRGAPAK